MRNAIGNRRGGLGVNTGRYWHHQRGVRHHGGCEGPRAHPHHTLADNGSLDPGSKRHDPPDELTAEPARVARVHAKRVQHIAEIEAHCLDFDRHLPLTGHRALGRHPG